MPVLAQDVGRSQAALRNGTPSPDTRQTNAAVWVNGASGTLVAPDLVLTNGHVLGIEVEESPPFSVTNTAYPDRWYDISDTTTIWVAVGSLRFGRSRVDTVGRAMNSRTLLVLDDRNGGNLEDGDEIGLKTTNDRYLFVRGGADGGTVEIDDLLNRYQGWQKLTVERVDGPGTVRSFDRIALKAADGSYIASLGRRRASLAQAAGTSRGREHEFVVMRSGGRGELRNGDSLALWTNPGGFFQYPFLVMGEQVSLPGYDDLALVRLDTPIPADVADPRQVMIRPPADSSSREAFYRGETFTVHGFGQVDGGTPAPGRQTGRFTNARLTGPTSVYRADGISGAGIMCGDSGSGWLWDGRLVGITQRGGCGAGGFTGGVFISPMSQGGQDPERNSKPDLTAWFGMHLDIDDCEPVTDRHRERQGAYRLTGATEVCRLGVGSPYALALFGGDADGDDCLRLNPDNLSLERPSRDSRWLLKDGSHSVLRIPGTWQQSYTRGAYLIDLAQRRNLRKICFVGRPNASLVYFRP